MKTLKSRLLLTVLSPLVLSLSLASKADAASGRINFSNGGYINIICNINPDQSKVVALGGDLGQITSTNLGLFDQIGRIIKLKVPVSPNGQLDFIKDITRKSVTRVTLIGSVGDSNGHLQSFSKDVTCS